MSRNRVVAAQRLARALRLVILAAASWATEASADAYAILSLIGDHVTIIGQGTQVGILGTTHPAAYAKDRTAWNALDQTQKTKALASLIKRGIEGKLPEMLGAPKQ